MSAMQVTAIAFHGCRAAPLLARHLCQHYSHCEAWEFGALRHGALAWCGILQLDWLQSGCAGLSRIRGQEWAPGARQLLTTLSPCAECRSQVLLTTAFSTFQNFRPSARAALSPCPTAPLHDPISPLPDLFLIIMKPAKFCMAEK